MHCLKLPRGTPDQQSTEISDFQIFQITIKLMYKHLPFEDFNINIFWQLKLVISY